ncbi:uncharacterized protein LOC128883964 [Hylaeus volcanicus]|uniref:uncharacterized protein LOC128883964 n=1 Tax=Hylaeus volcanicus TaxID=313075 RepID=UPI0023B7BB21|nr:uncharacterized protein LOC128883964 [Hylaeus volcanicus]
MCEGSLQLAQASGFSPYVDNGGTVLGLAGNDFAVCLADTRLSTGYRIHSRTHHKFLKLTDSCVIASSGMQADIRTLHKLLQHQVEMYQSLHKRTPSIESLAQMLSGMLYQRRFFPFYAFNALIGLDKNGKGTVFDYDAIGSFQRSSHTSRGSGSSLATSILDNQIQQNNQILKETTLTKLDMIHLAQDVMVSVAERDIYTGDSADVVIIDASGVHVSTLELRKH